MMLILLLQDLIVLEVHYHKCCHRVYTQKVQNLLTSSSRTNLYKDVECETLREIVKQYYEQIIKMLTVLRYIFSIKDIIMRESPNKFDKAQYYHI